MEGENNTNTTMEEQEVVNVDFEDTGRINEELNEKTDDVDHAKKSSRKVGRIIWSVVMSLIFLFVLFDAIMGILDMYKLNNNSDPVWYFSTSVKEENNKKQTFYNLGLYDIVKIEENGGTRMMLKPFFIQDK